jgi:hypothetical protein
MICPGWVVDTYLSQNAACWWAWGGQLAAPATAFPWMAPRGLGPRLRSPARRPASPGAVPAVPAVPREGPVPGERGGRPAGRPRGCGTGGVGTAPLPHPCVGSPCPLRRVAGGAAGRSGRRAGPAAGPWPAGREYDIHVSEWGPVRGGSCGKGGAPGWRCTVAYALRSVTSPGKRADGVSRPPLISLRCIQFVTQLKHIPAFVAIPRTCL